MKIAVYNSFARLVGGVEIYLERATLLDDGRELFAGGRGDNPDRVLDDAEIFDPAGGSFAPCKNKLSARQMEQHAVSLH